MKTLSPLPALRTSHGMTLTQLHDALWRVTRSNGSVVGYIELVEHDEQRQSPDSYRAKRLAPSLRSFIHLGDFWQLQDAIDCLRFA